MSDLTIDAAGNLYGTTYTGGGADEGSVFEIARGSNAITTLASFIQTTGFDSKAPVTLDGSGNIYGTTGAGGLSSAGTVFEIPRGSGAATVIANFGGTSKIGPAGGVILDALGDLFGAGGGGTNGKGCVYEVATGSNTVTTVASFNGTTNGYAPTGLTMDASGNLYGATAGGGDSSGDGTVFEIAAGSTSITTLALFNKTDGSNPVAGLMIDSSGNLFGTTKVGGANSDGVVFEVANSSNSITALASFATSVGSDPSGVALDASGDLYGTCFTGGASGNGDVFELASGSNAITVLASFDVNNGVSPSGPVIVDASGDVYGTTTQGGANNDGTVFEITKGSGLPTTVATFAGTNGSDPDGGLVADAYANLYGTTSGGGADSLGTVFEIARGSYAITTLASFNGTNGKDPIEGLTTDSAGNLYGTAGNVVFKVVNGSNAITDLATLSGNSTAGVTLDGSGNIYGTTYQGGTNGDGTIWELPHGSNVLTVLASLSPANGSYVSGLTMDASGDLYGTIHGSGGGNNGDVFELAKGSNAIIGLVSFGKEFYPQAGLTIDSAGNLYGTTYGSTSYLGSSVVFEILKGSRAILPLAQPGASLASQLTLDAEGNLYGVTPDGAASQGSVFELTPNTTLALTPSGNSNPSIGTQPLTFTTTVSGGPPNGETVKLVDASNNNAVVATGTLSNGSVTLTVPAGTLRAGTHNLIAVYGGDANFAASESPPYAQNVQVAVTNVQVNGNLPSLIGAQRSMVDSILYTFSEPVNISGEAATLAIHSGQTGTLPTSLTWAAIDPSSDGSSTQWAVSFSGNGVVGNSIANGVYDITLNSSDVTSDANPSVNVQARPTDTFYRLFGDINGDGVVNASENFQFKSAMNIYNAAFDYNGDGAVNAADNFQFKNSMSLNFSSSGIVYTI